MFAGTVMGLKRKPSSCKTMLGGVIGNVSKAKGARRTVRSSSVDTMNNIDDPTSGEETGAAIETHNVVLQYEPGRLKMGTLHRRYKRFLGDVQIGGEDSMTVVHVPNTGPMTGLLDNLPARVVLSKSDSKTRKYAHTLEWIEDVGGNPTTWVGIHSSKANAMVASLLDNQSLSDVLPAYHSYKREVKYGSSRLDFELETKDGPRCLIEVKSVTMIDRTGQVCVDYFLVVWRIYVCLLYAVVHVRQLLSPLSNNLCSSSTLPILQAPVAVFPDTKSVRAQRHIEELIDARNKGLDAALLFLIQRDDCVAFAPCHEKDPRYGELLIHAHNAGVRILPVQCSLDIGTGSVISRRSQSIVPLDLHFKQPSSKEQDESSPGIKRVKTRGTRD